LPRDQKKRKGRESREENLTERIEWKKLRIRVGRKKDKGGGFAM